MHTNNNWEIVDKTGEGDYTERLVVPGGWLYRNVIVPYAEDKDLVMAMVFVPTGSYPYPISINQDEDE